MIILMKGLNEEKAVNRCVGDFHDADWVDRVLVIDGGSNDNTVPELKRFSKVEVYEHKWLDWYHDMEVSQSNIALSYVPHGEVLMIVDFDERLSPELKTFLGQVNANWPFGDNDAIHFSRRTFEVMRHDDSTFCLYDEQGWPLLSHQIGQYPDYQCRLIRKSPFVRWINSPHHVLIGQQGEAYAKEGLDIIHFEKDDYRDRERIEAKWLRAQVRRQELGLTADRFECRVKPEFSRYLDTNYWRNPRG